MCIRDSPIKLSPPLWFLKSSHQYYSYSVGYAVQNMEPHAFAQKFIIPSRNFFWERPKTRCYKEGLYPTNEPQKGCSVSNTESYLHYYDKAVVGPIGNRHILQSATFIPRFLGSKLIASFLEAFLLGAHYVQMGAKLCSSGA